MTTSASQTIALPEGIDLPQGFTTTHVRGEFHGGVPVTVTRFQTAVGEPNHGGEHVTTVIGADDGVMYGYTRQLVTRGTEQLPDDEAARRVAFDFLEWVAPEHVGGLSLCWIARHDEEVADADGAAGVVAGIKVKTRHESGLYTWVIVGEGEQVITYERDVAWDTDHARRQTGMWLHDRWIIARDTHGAELEAPAAPLTA
ncbi:hypothetical protein [Nocardiopsis lucentensis]|uniref:hypothetical protein n=1 Tax=Nocardiopsis lucentensis TaxID=53441 RepID=UPI00034B49C7|nr:hypothetical protein [Nocardiopsis lucentensis]